MKYPLEVKIRAEKMYVRDGLDPEEISERTGVPISTIWRWRRQRDWERRREEWLDSTAGSTEKLLRLVHETIKDMDHLDSKSVDLLVKAAKVLSYVGNRVDPLSGALIVTEELIRFLKKRRPKLHDQFVDLLPEFLGYIRDRYKYGYLEGQGEEVNA